MKAMWGKSLSGLIKYHLMARYIARPAKETLLDLAAILAAL